MKCVNCGNTTWRKKGYRKLKNTLGSRKKKVRRFQCKECGYQIYYRQGLYNKLRLRQSQRVFDEFRKATNVILKDGNMKPSINNIIKKMDRHGKLVNRTTIGRWLNIFYPNREMWHYDNKSI
jgi:predicted nucleic-acid-binding Zn-ribbon protein